MLVQLGNRIASWSRSDGGVKPYDAEVEYLESTGTQYIDTGIYGGIKSAYYIDMEVTDRLTSYQQYFGGSKNSYAPKLLLNDTDFVNGWVVNEILGGARASLFNGVIVTSPNVRAVIEYKNNTIYLDGVALRSDTQNRSFGTISYYLFTAHEEFNLSSAMKVYALKMWRDGVLVLNFIPVRVGSGENAIGYMYDKVSRQLFGNIGTGEFVLGPDKDWVNPYVTDGLIAMWDGEWNVAGGVHKPNPSL